MTNDPSTAGMSEANEPISFNPITMQDVRLAIGEGKLTPADVLAGCNAELEQRARMAAPVGIGKTVIVPVEPTDEMIDAYCEKIESLGFTKWANLSTLWPVVLAAAPVAEVTREQIAGVIVDMTGAGTLGLTNEASLRAAEPIADAILALFSPTERESGR